MGLWKTRRGLVPSRLKIYRVSVSCLRFKGSLILRKVLDGAQVAKADEYWSGIRISSTQGAEASSFGMDGAGLLGEISAL